MNHRIYKRTREERARGAAEAWRKQNETPGDGWMKLSDGSSAKIKYEALVGLGPNPNPNDVDRIIGNTSWTVLECYVCDQTCQAVVVIETVYRELGPIQLCGRCAGHADSKINEKR